MTRDEVRRAVGAPFREFKKSAASATTTDAFEELLVHVYYRADTGGCELVELGGGTARPVYRKRDLLGGSFADAVAWLRTMDPSLRADATGLEARALGIALYAPFAEEEPERPADGASAFEPDYYERYGL